MKNYTLNVFKNFKCINKNCKHSCCTLWEIDIDNRSLGKYRKVSSTFQQKLAHGIDYVNKCFKMNKNGKCYFLNNDGLCDIIINLGDKYLCQTCRDHPRFRNFFSKQVEFGIGLCCEEGTRMLLSFDKKIKSVFAFDDKKKIGTLSTSQQKFEKKVGSFRKNALRVLSMELSFQDKIDKLIEICGVDKDKFLSFNWKNKFLSLDRLTIDWSSHLQNANFEAAVNFDTEKYDIELKLTNILYYFIYRNIPRTIDFTDLKSRLLFSVLSVYVIFAVYLGGIDNGLTLNDAVREYSTEIEYSDDNFYKLLDILDNFTIKIK